MLPIRLFLLPLFVVAFAWAAKERQDDLVPSLTGAGSVGIPGLSAPVAIDEDAAAETLAQDTDPMVAFTRQLEADANLAAELVALGEAKSRNLFEITSRQRRMGALLDETDAFLAASELPAEAVPAVAAYREGASSVRAAMADAQAGFVRFDWERVRQATAELRDGEAALRRAAALGAG